MNPTTNHESKPGNASRRAGSTIVDLVMLGGVLGCLALFGFSRARLANEEAEASRTADFLCDLHRAQQQYFETHGEFATSIHALDLRLSTPVFFDIRPIEITKDGWTAQAVRTGPGTGERPARLSIDQVGLVRSSDGIEFATTQIGSVHPRTKR